MVNVYSNLAIENPAQIWDKNKAIKSHKTNLNGTDYISTFSQLLAQRSLLLLL